MKALSYFILPNSSLLFCRARLNSDIGCLIPGAIVQFIEKNSFNVRSAIYHLKKDGVGLEFLLFPMIHVGSQSFYNEVADRLNTCDLILAEGVSSKRARLLTFSYRIVKRIKRMDLVTQGDGLVLSTFKDRIVNSDMTGNAFDERWSSLPLLFRAELFLLIPVYAVYLLLFGTRETLAENIALEDLPSADELLFQDDRLTDLDSLLIDERDHILISNIRDLNDANGNRMVGVVYGAMHMRQAINFLLNVLNYRVAKAEWVTVFDL